MTIHDFTPVQTVARLMAGFPHPWFVSGGWAIDLFVDAVTRSHSDLEVGLFRDHQRALWQQFAGWRMTKSDFLRPEGRGWVPWDEGDWVAAPLFQVQAWGPDATEWPTYDFFLNDTVDGRWQFRREPSLTRPISEIVLHSPAGIPFLAPDIQLAFKAKHMLPKNDHDFAIALPLLTAAQRDWLAMALRAAYGEHPWLAAVVGSR